MKITIKELRERNACKSGLEWFEWQFGDSMEVTLENLKIFPNCYLDWLSNMFRLPRELCLQFPIGAYRYARNIDRGPKEDTRAAVCEDPEYAFLYAVNVDKGPRGDTRAVVCKDPWWAYMYASNVDGCPQDDTRAAACKDPRAAYYYALNVDECPRDDTMEAAYRDLYYRARYYMYIENENYY